MNEENKEDIDLRGCADCPFYNVFGAHKQTAFGTRIRCDADERGNGLTRVAKSQKDCRHLPSAHY